MTFVLAFLVTSLLSYVTATLDCPPELKNCSCVGSTASCNEHGYYQLPESIIFDLDLKYFYFDKNAVTAINDTHFKNFVRVTHLSLRENQISSITEQAFHNVLQLRSIDLAYNHLTYLPKKLFQRLDFLERVYLSFNKLKRIETDHFTHLITLKDVRLNNNELTHLGKDTFINSRGLTQLYLEFNKLEIPEKNWLIHFDHKRADDYEVYMDDNRWSCDCRMRDFFEWGRSNPWFLQHDMDGVSVPECQAPVSLKGISLARIPSINDLKCTGANIISIARNVKVVEGQNVTLACKGTGFPTPFVSIIDPKGKEMSTGRGSTSYKFAKSKVQDSGEYMCNVSGFKFHEETIPTYEAASINLNVYRTPANVATIVIISLFIIGVGMGVLIWVYKKKCGSKALYGRLPNSSPYYDASTVASAARYNAESIHNPLSRQSAPTSVVNPYHKAEDSADDDDDDVIAEYNKDTEFLV